MLLDRGRPARGRRRHDGAVGLWQHLDGIGESAKPVHRDPELRAATVADGQLVTVADDANAQTLTSIDAGTGAARWSAAGVDPVPAGLEPAVVGGALVVPRYRRVDTIDLATGAAASAASAAETAVLSVSAAALVARRGERVTVLAPG
jgi:hypothetical protein